MASVFVSSLIRGFEEYRDAARRAIQRSGWVPVLSEDQPAQDIAPRAALLREVARADAYLLILGASYGTTAVPSPTEEEYREAVRLGKSVLVMVEEGVERETEQQAFLERVSAGWSDGRYRVGFASADALQSEIGFALRALEKEMEGGDGRGAAVGRVAALLDPSSHHRGQSPSAHLAVVPTGGARLMTSMQLNEGSIAGELAELVRRAGLAGRLAGFSASESADGIEITEHNDRFHGEQLFARLGVDGALLVAGPIGGEGQLGGMWVDPDRLGAFVRSGLALAPQVWEVIGSRETVRTAAFQVMIPMADSRSYGRPRGSSVSMGAMMRPSEILAPDEPEIATAPLLAASSPAAEILARIERAYRDAGAVNT